jgi:uncharacterized membrane protein YobD (UPF0266 family)
MSSLQEQPQGQDIRTVQFASISRAVVIILILLLPLLGVFLLAPPLSYQVLIVWVALLAFYTCRQPLMFLIGRTKSGTTRLDLGYINKASGGNIVGSIFIGVMWLIMLLLTGLRNPALAIAQLGLSVAYFADALSKLITNREPTVVTDKGIYGPKILLPWNRIESRQWLNQHEDALLILKLKNRPWPFDETTLRIPVSFKADVDKALREKGIA